MDVRDIVYDILGIHYLKTADVILCRQGENQPFAKVNSDGKTVLRVGKIYPDDMSGIVIKIK